MTNIRYGWGLRVMMLRAPIGATNAVLGNNSVYFKVQSMHFKVESMQFKVENMQFKVQSMQFKVCSVHDFMQHPLQGGKDQSQVQARR